MVPTGSRAMVRPRSPQPLPDLQFVAFAHGQGLGGDLVDLEVLVPELGSSGGRAHYSPHPPTQSHHQPLLALASCLDSPVHILAHQAEPCAGREDRLRPQMLFLLDRRQSKVTKTPSEQNQPSRPRLRWLRGSCFAVVGLLLPGCGPRTSFLPGLPSAC